MSNTGQLGNTHENDAKQDAHSVDVLNVCERYIRGSGGCPPNVRSEEARVDNIHENRFDDEIEAKANRVELQP